MDFSVNSVLVKPVCAVCHPVKPLCVVGHPVKPVCVVGHPVKPVCDACHPVKSLCAVSSFCCQALQTPVDRVPACGCASGNSVVMKLSFISNEITLPMDGRLLRCTSISAFLRHLSLMILICSLC